MKASSACEVHGIGLHTAGCNYGTRSMSAGSPASKEGGVSEATSDAHETNALPPGEFCGLHQEPGVMSTLMELRQCALSHEPDSRLLGNVRADDMARALFDAMAALRCFPVRGVALPPETEGVS